MGYLFCLLALLVGVTKGYCGKKTSGYLETITDAMRVTTLRMFFCVLIGAALLLSSCGDGLFAKLNMMSLIVALVSGVSTAAFVVSWILSVKQGAYMLVEVFVMLGVIVPLLLSCWFLGETVTLTDLTGDYSDTTPTVENGRESRSTKSASAPIRCSAVSSRSSFSGPELLYTR